MSFDTVINRLGTHSVKWDGMEPMFGVAAPNSADAAISKNASGAASATAVIAAAATSVTAVARRSVGR